MVFAFLGTSEIIIILVIALLVFGPEKLPQIGKQVGTAMRELNKVRNDVQKALEFDEFANLGNLDSYTGHDTYDNNYHTAGNFDADTDNPLPSYESPPGTLAVSGEEYAPNYSVDDSYIGSEDNDGGETSVMHDEGEPLPNEPAARVYQAPSDSEGSDAKEATRLPPGPAADFEAALQQAAQTAQQGTV